MDLQVNSPSRNVVKCCDCGCTCSLTTGCQWNWFRSVKRKYDEFEDGNRFFIPGFDLYVNPRVEIENECVALRETVSSQQQAIQDLYAELDEERNAASSAANEAMSMMLRLQREKAEVQIESRQFKRFAEEKMAHDQQELLALEDLLYKRDQVIQALTCEVHAYKHRMMSYGLTELEAEGEKGLVSGNQSTVENFDAQFDLPLYDYPPLKCNLNENSGALEGDYDVADVEKYAFGETPCVFGETPRAFGENPCAFGESPRSYASPRGQNYLKNLEYRIHQMERNPNQNQLEGDFSSGKNIMEKVIVGHSPRWPRHKRMFSTDSSSSYWGMIKESGPDLTTESPRFNGSIKRVEQVKEYSNLRKMDNASEIGDEMSDRVYTVDSVRTGVQYNGVTESKAVFRGYDDYVTTPRDLSNQPDFNDPDIKKLYMRLQTLEADRESLKQEIISMRTDKAQMILLKEIAQHLCMETTPERRVPVKKPSARRSFSFMSVFKWAASFVFWRKKAFQSKYMYGLSANNVGLLMLLEKAPCTSQWRCLTSTQV